MMNMYKDKNILVTGGVGSIGTALVSKLKQFDPKSIRVLDIDENRLFECGNRNDTSKIRTFVGDIRDKERLRRAIKGIDIVFHAAALKHVPLCEYNPFEAIKTNVVGTQNLIEVAMDENIEKFITISTDKAVNPINVMGATKLLAERLTISANSYKGYNRTVFSCCRFGNVIDSRGSVIPLFINQIKNEKKVTITDMEMTRFMMTLDNAIELIIEIGEMSQGSEIFILKMPVVRIIDLAEVLIEKMAQKYDFNPEEIKIEFIGKRAGEKIYEQLVTPFEYNNCYESDTIYVIVPPYNKSHYTQVKIPPNFKKVDKLPASSDNMPFLKKEEIYDLIKGVKY